MVAAVLLHHVARHGASAALRKAGPEGPWAILALYTPLTWLMVELSFLHYEARFLRLKARFSA